jgi:uncharacterized OsmC-like protein
MADQQTIREISERHERALALKPERGQLACSTRARLVDGMRCEIEEGPWRFAADMPRKLGGDETAPTPGVLGRGALAGCLVIGIARWAARLGVPIDALEATVEAHFDARGELGADDRVPPGYTEIRYAVAIKSPAGEAAIAELLAIAERYSPYLDNFGRPVTLRRVETLHGRGA